MDGRLWPTAEVGFPAVNDRNRCVADCGSKILTGSRGHVAVNWAQPEYFCAASNNERAFGAQRAIANDAMTLG